MKAAIYARISTEDKGQDIEQQIEVLKKRIQEEAHELCEVYRDEGVSGRKAERPEFNRMMYDASFKKFKILYVWSIDRLSRGGIKATKNIIDNLESYGVKFHSLQESHLSTDNELAKNIMLDVLSWAAQQESIRIGESVKRGIEAKRDEKGYWKLPQFDYEKAIRLRIQGLGYKRIAKELSKDKTNGTVVSPSSVYYLLNNQERLKRISPKFTPEGIQKLHDKVLEQQGEIEKCRALTENLLKS